MPKANLHGHAKRICEGTEQIRDKNYLIYIRKEELDGSRKSKCKLFY
ncbi:MAG: hypothetical protein K6G84_06765 [Lachnospiraceae bacterium]|nr:hypothetical protein [Lachnospiraceae bacterium]